MMLPSRKRAVVCAGARPDRRIPDLRVFGTSMLLSLVFASSAWASGTGMPWETPLNGNRPLEAALCLRIVTGNLPSLTTSLLTSFGR